jgi:hypothetical protein
MQGGLNPAPQRRWFTLDAKSGRLSWYKSGAWLCMHPRWMQTCTRVYVYTALMSLCLSDVDYVDAEPKGWIDCSAVLVKAIEGKGSAFTGPFSFIVNCGSGEESSHAHTHAHMHARTQARTHARRICTDSCIRTSGVNLAIVFGWCCVVHES